MVIIVLQKVQNITFSKNKVMLIFKFVRLVYFFDQKNLL